MNTSQGSQFIEQLEAIEDKIDEIGLVMTALNGLTRPWDSIQTICARKESLKFDILWEYCVQEEAIVDNQEALLRYGDHALSTHTRRRKRSTISKMKIIRGFTLLSVRIINPYLATLDIN